MGPNPCLPASYEDGRELANTAAGHLLRSRPRDTREGGFARGTAALDTPLLL